MDTLFLIKPGEILLKQDNQREFTRRLAKQIAARMCDSTAKVEEYPGRFFLWVPEELSGRAEFVLSHCPGVNGYSKAEKCPKTVDDVISAAIRVAAEAAAAGLRSFKVETRRSDKSFPLGSYETSALVGERILDAVQGLEVRMKSPDFTVNIEVRERAYIYGITRPGPRGLPTGSAGKGLLLLSGGIDSPVAGYMMAKRGLALEAIYFHAYPYTSDEAKDKVVQLAKKIAAWTGGIRLWVLPFTEVQMAIKRRTPDESATLMLRSAMMEASHLLAGKIRAQALITGESLGQVASQTAQSMRVTQSLSDLPIFRPLIGHDKEDTIAMARAIGTFDISILPYEDCCVLFSPVHPLLRPELAAQSDLYGSLNLGTLIQQSLDSAELVRIGYPEILADL